LADSSRKYFRLSRHALLLNNEGRGTAPTDLHDRMSTNSDTFEVRVFTIPMEEVYGCYALEEVWDNKPKQSMNYLSFLGGL
jgi:hypothetical protein